MSRMRFFPTLAVAALFASAAVCHAQNIVSDPGFEADTIGNYTNSALSGGVWSVTNTLEVTNGPIGSGHNVTYFNRDNGATPGATLFQTLTTLPGRAYTLNFDYGSDFTPGDTEAISVLLNGVAVTGTPINPQTGSHFTSLNVPATSASSVLTFGFSSTAYNAAVNNTDLIYLDNVSLVLNPVSSVPEPGAVSLIASFAIPAAGFALRRRRKYFARRFASQNIRPPLPIVSFFRHAPPEPGRGSGGAIF